MIEFDLGSTHWDASGMMELRSILDALYGIAYPPLKGRALPEEQENAIRESVGEYHLAQVRVRKGYNFNILNSSGEAAF
ncbi:MAG: hypothetical protein IIB67_12135 [Proteobacteria bacterium]|nr:hypothetical protein [Pseudomonadota bacterium]